MPSSCRLFAGISAPDEPMAWTGTVLPCVAYLLVFFFSSSRCYLFIALRWRAAVDRTLAHQRARRRRRRHHRPATKSQRKNRRTEPSKKEIKRTRESQPLGNLTHRRRRRRRRRHSQIGYDNGRSIKIGGHFA